MNYSAWKVAENKDQRRALMSEICGLTDDESARLAVERFRDMERAFAILSIADSLKLPSVPPGQ